MRKMYFFEDHEEFKNRIFCIDEEGRKFTYGQIREMGDTIVSPVPRRSLVLQLVGNDVASVSCYLALLRRRCPVILMGKNTDQALVDRMIEVYRPRFIASRGGVERREYSETGMGNDRTGREHDRECGREHERIDPELALLLSTSGSTGAQKLVRLSYDNLQANCDSIVSYLGLTAEERPITTLPMEYTYGLSVIHSHAAVGASIILTDRTLFEPKFWELAENLGATSMAGVPYTYEMFQRLRLQRMNLPKLRTLTQAGGHLKTELQESYAKWAKESGRRFFVMYGQTEATARMSYIPWEKCGEKIGSIGIPVPGGRIGLLDENGGMIEKPGVSGELIYYGKNVSLGYAVCRADLGKGDENNGRLETGDIAYRDEDGYYFITGRKKRFVKLYGKRISMDQIQDDLQESFHTPDIVCTGDDTRGITVWLTPRAIASAAGTDGQVKTPADGEAGEDISKAEEKLRQTFFERWGIRDSLVHIQRIDAIPRNSSGKTIYAQLKAE